MQRRSSLILMGHANILMSWNSGEMKYFPAMLVQKTPYWILLENELDDNDILFLFLGFFFQIISSSSFTNLVKCTELYLCTKGGEK